MSKDYGTLWRARDYIMDVLGSYKANLIDVHNEYEKLIQHKHEEITLTKKTYWVDGAYRHLNVYYGFTLKRAIDNIAAERERAINSPFFKELLAALEVVKV